MFRIETPRLLIRNITVKDAPTLMVYRNIAEVARFQSWLPNYTLESIREFVQPLARTEIGSKGQWNQIALIDKKSNIHIGDIAFRRSEEGLQGELGFTLHPAYHHQGLATEGVTAFISWVFQAKHIHRIYAICDERNLAAQKLLERLHFRQEGHFLENIFFKGEWGNEFLYAILEKEWNA